MEIKNGMLIIKSDDRWSVQTLKVKASSVTGYNISQRIDKGKLEGLEEISIVYNGGMMHFLGEATEEKINIIKKALEENKTSNDRLSTEEYMDVGAVIELAKAGISGKDILLIKREFEEKKEGK